MAAKPSPRFDLLSVPAAQRARSPGSPQDAENRPRRVRVRKALVGATFTSVSYPPAALTAQETERPETGPFAPFWCNSGEQAQPKMSPFAGRTARRKTCGVTLREYESRPEANCADAEGNVCSKQTIGPLHRRHIRIGQIKYIGKESNLLEDMEASPIHSAASVYTEYPDPRRDEWQTKILPAVKRMSLKQLVEACKGRLSRRALIDIRAGRSRPHRRNQEMLARILGELGLI
jgi:hypothetical protein